MGHLYLSYVKFPESSDFVPSPIPVLQSGKKPLGRRTMRSHATRCQRDLTARWNLPGSKKNGQKGTLICTYCTPRILKVFLILNNEIKSFKLTIDVSTNSPPPCRRPTNQSPGSPARYTTSTPQERRNLLMVTASIVLCSAARYGSFFV